MLKETAEIVQCYHCGEECQTTIIPFQNKPFCCEGCKTVYEILSSNDLCEYYDLDNNPGIKRDKDFGDQFAYLDNEDIQKQLLAFTDGKTSKVIFHLPTIHCSSCIWLLENLGRLHAGVLASEVNFTKKEITVSFDNEKVSLRQLAELLASVGYEPNINLASTGKDKPNPIPKSLYYKIGVAGFCFGNIMLLSFPEYLSGDTAFIDEYARLFSYLNLALALPIFFYCSTDYFRSAFKSLKHGVVNIDFPISLGIIILFGRSAYEILSQTGAGYMDSLAGLLFFLLVGKWFQTKTYEALSFERDYKSYFPLAVLKLLGEKEEPVPVDQLKIGDRLRIRNQEIIPADAVLTSTAASIDYSFVTGESTPVYVEKGALIYAGGKQVGNSIEVMVEKEVSQSYLTQLWNKQRDKQEYSVITTITDNASKYFTFAILGIALVTGIYWYVVAPSLIFSTITAVLIVACPCALALALPFALGNSIRILGKKQFYAKNTNTIENLAKVDTIVFDKTGTLTDSKNVNVNYRGEVLSEEDLCCIKSIAGQSTHPLSRAIYDSIDVRVEDPEYVDETPGMGLFGAVNGNTIKIGSIRFMNAEVEVVPRSSEVYVQINGQTLGVFQIERPYREGITGLIKQLRSRHKEVHVLSGDNDGERNLLEQLFSQKENLNFNCSPVDKLNYIKKLQSQGKTVLMVGDGLNDAGALGQSDVGIAVSDDVNSFAPACDVIMAVKKLPDLNWYMDFAKDSIKVVKASFVLSIIYNTIGIAFAVQGLLTPVIAAILMPLSSITVVTFVTLATNIMASRAQVILPEIQPEMDKQVRASRTSKTMTKVTIPA